MEMTEKIRILKNNSHLVYNKGDGDQYSFRINFNKYSEPEITSLGFKTANGCVFVSRYGARGVIYGCYGEREYIITDREVMKLLLAYAESENIPVAEGLARQTGYVIGSNLPEASGKNVKLGTFTVDVEMQQDGKFDVFVAHEGSSGVHYTDVTADKIGELVADEVETTAEAYQQ